MCAYLTVSLSTWVQTNEYIDTPQLGKLIFKIAYKLTEYCRFRLGRCTRRMGTSSIRKSNNHFTVVNKWQNRFKDTVAIETTTHIQRERERQKLKCKRFYKCACTQNDENFPHLKRLSALSQTYSFSDI